VNNGGSSPLYERIKNGDKHAVSFVIEFNSAIKSSENQLAAFSTNTVNVKEAGMTCLHRACISPSLIILADVLHDRATNALSLDNRLMTGYKRVPKHFLTSCKVAVRYERRQFVASKLQIIYAKPADGVEDHEDQQLDNSQLNINRTNQSIPVEISRSDKYSINNKIKHTGVVTSISTLDRKVPASPLVKRSDLFMRNTSSKKNRVFEERDEIDSRSEVRVFKPIHTIRKEVGSEATSHLNRDGSISINRLSVIPSVSSRLSKEASYCLTDEAVLIEKLKSELMGPLADTVDTYYDLPVSEKIREYPAYNTGYMVKKSKPGITPFLVKAQTPVSNHLDNRNLSKIDFHPEKNTSKLTNLTIDRFTQKLSAVV
jgi:hypothetical protein